MTAFEHARRVMPHDYDAFFRWIPEEHRRAQTDPTDATQVVLVMVDAPLIALYHSEPLTEVVVEGEPGRVVETTPEGVVVQFEDGGQADHPLQPSEYDTPTPVPGYYVLYWDEDGRLTAFSYGFDERRAVHDAQPFLEASLEGEDPFDPTQSEG